MDNHKHFSDNSMGKLFMDKENILSNPYGNNNIGKNVA